MTMTTTTATATTAVSSAKRLLLGTAQSRAFRCLWMLEELGLDYQHVPAKPQSESVKRYNPLGKIPVLVDNDGLVLFESGAILSHLGDKYRNHHRGSGRSNAVHHHSNNNNNMPPLPLVPVPGTPERARYEQTMSVLLTELDAQGLWIHRKHDEDAMGKFFGTIPEAVAHARKYFHKTNRFLIRQLETAAANANDSDSDSASRQTKSQTQTQNNSERSSRPSYCYNYYLLGTHFSAVDIVYVNCLEWSATIGWDDKWRQNETVARYLEACRSRPAYQNVRAAIRREREVHG
eukprot:CAMPEP_0172380264 /NCGR_PEP_ID=MMETSP1060-20121228/70350_1 /TAXON_ID=37318 /ORGANISM="Pseudo-nitzschia pungens, Strain cf. cingulata" /LENGTH=290 /DNA_ID=CAMNT_0013108017 /DNA_START=125 /DNA_END=994 /DNA_ORIENTATION=-